MKPLEFTIPTLPGKTIMVQEDRLPRFYPYLHRHKETQLIWIKQGEGTLFAETGMHDFKKDDIFMIGPYQSHLFKSIETPEGVASLSVFFDLKKQVEMLFQWPELESLKLPTLNFNSGFKLLGENNREVFKLMEKLKSSSDLERYITFVEIINLLHKTKLEPLTESTKEFMSDQEGMRMRKVYDYTFQNYKTTISLDQAANLVHLTPQAFCRYFKKHTGRTFVDFVNSLRVNAVQKMLIDGNFTSIAEAAYANGFNSINHFNRVFKKIAGSTPKKYLLQFPRG